MHFAIFSVTDETRTQDNWFADVCRVVRLLARCSALILRYAAPCNLNWTQDEQLLPRFGEAVGRQFLNVGEGGGRRARAPDGAAEGHTVLAVVVCFEPHRPEHEVLPITLARLLRQSGVRALLIDNSESEAGRSYATRMADELGIELIRNESNIGVAAAHNIGLRKALSDGFDYALILDQDSELEEDTITRLVDAHRFLESKDLPVGAVGPAFSDPRSGFSFPFVSLRTLRMQRLEPAPGQAVECDLLISSGCLISARTLRSVGGMDERLFIDFVDIEWCLRARSLGWKLFGVADAHMRHTIGDRILRILGRSIPVHSPARNYYLVRNALLVARKPYLTWRWRAHLAYRIVGQLVLFTVFFPDRPARIRCMVRGFADGLLGRGGRLGAAGPQDAPYRSGPADSGVAADRAGPTSHANTARSKIASLGRPVDSSAPWPH